MRYFKNKYPTWEGNQEPESNALSALK